ncbi:hypothetical protein ACWFMI_09790 [Nocardiopsis terrae]
MERVPAGPVLPVEQAPAEPAESTEPAERLPVTGTEPWSAAAPARPLPVPGGFEERIAGVRAVPASLLGRALFRASFGLLKVG